MKIAVAVMSDGKVNIHFGRADKLALADVANGKIIDWKVVDAPFADMHGDHPQDGSGHQPKPTHQNTIKQFLEKNDVDVVFVNHAGPGLQKVKDETDIKIVTGAQGSARGAIEALLKKL